MRVVTLLSLLVIAVPDVSWGQVTALHFGRAWLGPGRSVNDAVIVVNSTRIESVGSGRAAIPRGARVVDLRRFTAIPGLIDVHTHMTFYWDRKPGTRPIGQQRHVAVTVFLAQDNTRKTLETGVTTVRNLNAQADSDIAMRDLIAMGAMTGPRMFVSGAGLNANNSPAPGDAKRLAEDRVKAGDDWVKVFASRGTYDNVSEEQTFPSHRARLGIGLCWRRESNGPARQGVSVLLLFARGAPRARARAACRRRSEVLDRARRGAARETTASRPNDWQKLGHWLRNT